MVIIETKKPWNLLADIGGTNVRFAVEDFEKGHILQIRNYSVAKFNSLLDALNFFMDEISKLECWEVHPIKACLAVAAVPDNPVIRFTNNSWEFTTSQISKILGSISVKVINDFESVALAVPALSASDWCQVGGSQEGDSGGNIVILGAGTGFGVAGLVSHEGGYKVVSGEGGHADFAPTNEKELLVFKFIEQKIGRVSIERLLSGKGIANIYSALISEKTTSLEERNEIAIGALAEEGQDKVSQNTMNIFFSILGSTSGNLALTFGARAGVYIAGGIVPRYISLLERSEFRARFEDKGRYRDYLKAIPTRVITRSSIGLLGAAEKLRGLR